MTVIARDAVALDHLVYAWPFPLGPDVEVSCGDAEQVVMCPAWMVGDRLGPGRHLWRAPNPMIPVAAFFVSTAPVDCTFDMTTGFHLPLTGQPVRLRATGSLQVRCADPGLLIAQFVGLPFEYINDGILRSVSRSIERMLARLLIRRVVMSGSPIAVTDPGMLPGIVEELVAYNPTAGAVFGVELIRMGGMVIAADDGSAPFVAMPVVPDWSGSQPNLAATNGEFAHTPSRPDIPLTETARGRPMPPPIPEAALNPTTASGEIRSGEISAKTTKRHASVPGVASEERSSAGGASASGEILVRPKSPVPTPPPIPAIGTSPPGAVIDVPRSTDDITQPGIRTPVPGALSARAGSEPSGHGAIMGIGMGGIGGGAIGGGSGAVSGEIPSKVPPGSRVLVPGPNGLMQSATVRQLLQGYYELEVGSSGETIWVPINGVVPE
ncbi:MAG: hypothetical protein ABI867_06340 [Kofleriaceae bacterium]